MRTDATIGTVGAALFEGSRVLAARRPIEPIELRVFRAANDVPDAFRLPIRTIMQAGTFAMVPSAAIVTWLLGRRRTAAEAVLAGTAAWLLAKAAKPLAGRPRPAAIVDAVRIRETISGDLGWASGHVAVATALSVSLSSMAPTWTRPLFAAVIAATGFGRMYVGAHLPLDLIGGLGLGMMCVVVVRVLRQAADGTEAVATS